MEVLVILPVYNEEDNLKELIPQILGLGDYLKILVVDDFSSDESLEVVSYFYKEKPEKIFVISKLKHSGRGNTVKQGYKFALENNFEYLIEMDADLSHRPEYIPFLLKEALGVDIAIGSRLIKGGSIHNRYFLRNLITYLANIYLRFILGLRIKDLTSGFRCLDMNFLRKVDISHLKSKGPQLLQEIIFKNKNNIRIKEIPIIFENRYRGRSKFCLSIVLKSLWLPLYWKIESLLSFSF